MKHFMFFLALSLGVISISAQPNKVKNAKFKVIAFYTGKNDNAHVSFVQEANQWFPKLAEKQGFSYEATSDWSNMNTAFLSKYEVVLFLDTRPENPEQRKAFEDYIKNGGAWMGFHFAAFALRDSTYPENWSWYHDEFLGSGGYGSNTWRPTSAVLRVEAKNHPALNKLPLTFKSSPNEWYRWSNDLRKNPQIKILLAIDSSSFPLGTGPKTHEIWHEGYYPVVWTNKNYKMIYVNMGHNDIDYEHAPYNKVLSQTFENKIQNQLIISSLMWLGKK
jgi:hypothetical protein